MNPGPSSSSRMRIKGGLISTATSRPELLFKNCYTMATARNLLWLVCFGALTCVALGDLQMRIARSGKRERNGPETTGMSRDGLKRPLPQGKAQGRAAGAWKRAAAGGLRGRGPRSLLATDHAEVQSEIQQARQSVTPALTGRRLLHDESIPRPEQPSNLPPEDQIASGDCSGWPEPRRYVEAHQWWTDDVGGAATEPSPSGSRRFALGACVPVDPVISQDFWLDAVIKLYNCQGTSRYVDAVGVYLAGQALDGFAEINFQCCNNECAQPIRMYANISDAGKNVNTTLGLYALMKASSLKGLPENKFASIKLDMPYTVLSPQFNETDENSRDSYVYVQAWARDPWNNVWLQFEQLPDAITPLGLDSVPVPVNVYSRKDWWQENPVVNLTSMMVSLDPQFMNASSDAGADGDVLLRYRRFSVPKVSQTPFLAAESLSPGSHALFVRADAYLPASKNPYKNVTGATSELRAGGTNSAGFLFTFPVAAKAARRA